MQTVKLNISIDDVNPSKDYRILGTNVEKYLANLIDDYDAKISLFIPSHYHNLDNTKLSENKQWVNELLSISDNIELCAHGHYHNVENKIYGECEFFELNDPEIIEQRISMIMHEWDQVGYIPRVWKSPKWLTSRQSVDALTSKYPMAVIHPIHNANLFWRKSHCITAVDYFPPNQFPPHDCNLFILSHIAGKHTNVWNENFYIYTRKVLDTLLKDCNLQLVKIKHF